MTIKNLFIFDAVVCFLFGVSFIVTPKDVAKLFFTDFSVTDAAISTFRSYGILLSGSAIALFFARNSLPSAARKGLLLFIIISGALTSVNLLYSVLANIYNNNALFVIVATTIITVWASILLPKENAAVSR